MRTRKEEAKLSLSVGDMTIFVESPKLFIHMH